MKATGDNFSHATLSFDISLDPMYSFGTKKIGPTELGFIVTNPTDKIWGEKPVQYSVFVMFVSKEDKEKMKSKLEVFVKNANKMAYSFAGLIRVFLHLKSPKRRKWFCSAFVAEVIGAGKHLNKKDSTLYRPQTLQEIDDVTFLISGDDISKYNVKEAKKALEKIKRT